MPQTVLRDDEQRDDNRRRIACQYVGVILLNSPFSPTHARASADH